MYYLLGLPFDALTMDETENYLLEAIAARRRCYLSNPNLNCVVSAYKDKEFRDTFLRSTVSVADGMPVVWLARLLGMPIRERVAGSDLFHRLRRKCGEQPPIKVFFFGGPDGVAERSAEVLNAERGGMVCVGTYNPGFGSVESMSSPDIIATINASGADFLVLALGTKKGNAWIVHNMHRLTVPVISHLGAVVNFVAGTVKRAPPWMRKAGLEWVWRIGQEPQLWRRYYDDGLFILSVLRKQIVPVYLWQRRFSQGSLAPGTVTVMETVTDVVVTLEGAWTAKGSASLQRVFARVADTEKALRFVPVGVTAFDSSFVALLMVLRRYRLDMGHVWDFGPVSPAVARLFRIYRAEDLREPAAPADGEVRLERRTPLTELRKAL
jgi:N-acetylglucosaminyldiphosphoundecaprenol N-acetyl-beta-D-mannosaminyltransferase